jgi:hypothetical protein
MADPIKLECWLPHDLADLRLADCETSTFGESMVHCYRVDADGQLWRQAYPSQREEKLDWSGHMAVDLLDGAPVQFRLRFTNGQLFGIDRRT